MMMMIQRAAVWLLTEHMFVLQAAPILLAILRLCQGLALGGEYGSALVYIQVCCHHQMEMGAYTDMKLVGVHVSST